MHPLALPLLTSAAHPPSDWTDKEVLLSILSAVGGTLCVVVPVAWGLVKFLAVKAERRAAPPWRPRTAACGGRWTSWRTGSRSTTSGGSWPTPSGRPATWRPP